MTNFLHRLNAVIWGAPALLLILGVGLYLTIQLSAAQLTLFPDALADFLKKLKKSGSAKNDTPMRALCTALAATVGTGNLVGVAGAICLGGPGAVFWIWVCGILGMATKYAETVLAVHYRVKTPQGYLGGPMYVIVRGLGNRWRFLAAAYCLLGVLASFGVGNAAQINAVIASINTVLENAGIVQTPRRDMAMGILLALTIGTLLLGGAGRIGAAAQMLVPFAATGYILMCIGLLICRAEALPGAVSLILRGAFSPRAATGGLIGSAFCAMRIGCSRGVFTNEAGMGTAAIAHGAADVSHPVQQGLMGIMEVFLDTILICTLTALVILTSGIPIPYGTDAGATLTAEAFSVVYGEWAAGMLSVALILFATATVLGWSFYGARCAQFLFGSRAWNWYPLIQIAVIVLSSVMDTAAVWQMSEVFNGLMAIPNLLTLAALAPVVRRLTKEYKKSGTDRTGGGNYADFHQCKPLRALSHAEIPPSGSGCQERGQEDLSPEHRPARPAYP